jgi:hypothetical protein
MTQVPDFLLEIPNIRQSSAYSQARRRHRTGGQRQTVPEDMKSALCRACSPLARRSANKFLECPAERGFGFVANIMGDSGNLDARISRKSLGGNLHAPLGQVLDRRTAHDLGKAIG